MNARTLLRAMRNLYERIGTWYLMPILRREWTHPPFPTVNERPIEYGFAFGCLARIEAREVLDVGAGRTAFPHLMANCGFRVTAIDKIEGYWQQAFSNRHYYIVLDDITQPQLDRTFDAVTCVSVLEHIPDHGAAMAGMFKLLRPGGHLVLTVPYCENRYFEDVYKLPEASYGHDWSIIAHAFSRRELEGWLTENRAEIVEQQYWDCFTGDVWAQGERLSPPRQVSVAEKHQLSCLLLRKAG